MTYKDAAGTVINLTNYTARMQVRSKASAPTTILSLTSSVGGGITLGGAAGTIVINIAASGTAALEPGDYVYDLELVNTTSTAVTRLIQGKFKVSAEVTR
jgi:hypothetical protein